MLNPNAIDPILARKSFQEVIKRFDTPGSAISCTHVGETFLFHTGFDSAFFNMATVPVGDPDHFEEILKIVTDWKVRHSIGLAGPALGFAEKLHGLGYLPSGATPFMGSIVDDRFREFSLRDGLTARRVNSPEDYEIVIAMLVATFGMPDMTARALFEPTAGSADTYRYLLLANGVPVSTNVFHLVGDVGGCFDVATPPEHQRKGYGAELMKYMLKEQAELGTTFIGLTSSPAGQKLYGTLGFQVIGYSQSWVK